VLKDAVDQVWGWLGKSEPQPSTEREYRPPPVCVLAGVSSGEADTIRSVLGTYGVELIKFDYANKLPRPDNTRNPNVVFFGAGDGDSDTSSIFSHVATPKFDGTIQVLGDVPEALRNSINKQAAQRGMRTLPPLQSPVTRTALEHVVLSEGLSRGPTGVVEIGLGIALTNHWIEFWYEPQIDLRTNMIHGAEARVRLRHPRYGVLLPHSFLPSAARQSLSLLGQSALRASVRDWAAFHRLGFNLRMSANLPIECLMGQNPEAVLDSIKWPSGPWPGLTVEVKETALANHWDAIRYFGLHAPQRGISLSIDKFAARAGSVDRLGRLTFQEVKIAEDLIDGCGGCADLAARCQATINLVHRLGKQAVATGIKCLNDLRSLRQMGCDFGQGAVFSSPLARENFALLLRQKSRS
jgi:EAL domain-containing protein (putative c-di-GMP-specific phosphodiesterase class I)